MPKLLKRPDRNGQQSEAHSPHRTHSRKALGQNHVFIIPNSYSLDDFDDLFMAIRAMGLGLKRSSSSSTLYRVFSASMLSDLSNNTMPLLRLPSETKTWLQHR